jgi:cellulose synthase/poly-beta-1,6-N-acetylglucosamine synthase-like glycosyltransferase
MRNAAKRPWGLKIDRNYKPKISIIVPTYNEADVIRFKLENLVRVNYPKELMQIIIVDSNSEDQTVSIVREFIRQHLENNFQILTQSERKGKSTALNFALKSCDGEVIVVSDADCFWPSNILENALPFLADPSVGGVSGPKILLNSDQSWVTKSENAYLNSMNFMKLGESKVGSTLLFEGGFSAYKREALNLFDPYNTGSDDCGSVIKLIENGYRALLIPEARFYSSFPTTWKGKLIIKIRRANQLVHVVGKYFFLLLKGRIKGSKRIVVQAFFLYLIDPIMFIGWVISTVLLLMIFPYLFLLPLTLLIPKVGKYILEIIQDYVVLFLSIIMAVFKKKFILWGKPEDRALIDFKVLHKYELI